MGKVDDGKDQGEAARFRTFSEWLEGRKLHGNRLPNLNLAFVAESLGSNVEIVTILKCKAASTEMSGRNIPFLSEDGGYPPPE